MQQNIELVTYFETEAWIQKGKESINKGEMGPSQKEKENQIQKVNESRTN